MVLGKIFSNGVLVAFEYLEAMFFRDAEQRKISPIVECQVRDHFNHAVCQTETYRAYIAILDSQDAILGILNFHAFSYLMLGLTKYTSTAANAAKGPIFHVFGDVLLHLVYRTESLIEYREYFFRH